jgi:hypothetical protein
MIAALSRRSDRSEQNQTKASIVYLRHVDEKPLAPGQPVRADGADRQRPSDDHVKAAPKKPREFLFSGRGN